MNIAPQIIATPDCPTVIIREPQEVVEKAGFDAVMQRILARQGWGLGTHFSVHFIDHDREKLLALGQFVVIEDRERLNTYEPVPDQPVTRVDHIRRYAQLGPWRAFEETEGVTVTPEANLDVEWNVGRRVHEVKSGNKVVGCDPDKAKAEAMARGEAPLTATEAKGRAA